MSQVNNSEVMTKVLNSFFHVIGTKTSPAHAWLTLKIILQNLEYEYDFIKNVDVVDIKEVNDFLKEKNYTKIDFSIVDIQTEVVDTIYKEEVGKAIQSLADKLKKSLGTTAGYHFMSEFINELGDEYSTIIKSIGVELRLVDMQDELYGRVIENYKLEEDKGSNIAFIEKK